MVHELHLAFENLAANGVTLRVVGGRLGVRGPGPAIAAKADTITRFRDVIVAHLDGAASGHALGWCTRCGEPSLVHYRHKTWPRCRMTPGCATADPPGRHIPDAHDIASLRAAGAPPAPTIPAPPRRHSKQRTATP